MIFRIPTYNRISEIAYRDAANWELCSKSLAQYGVFPTNISDWCLRRPINIEFLAILYRLTHSMKLIYIIFNFIFVFVLIWSYRNFKIILPKIHSLSLLFLAYGLWAVFANNMVLSESLGLILGILSVGLMAKLLISNDARYLIFLATTLVLIQMIRPGNLILPFLLVALVPIIHAKFKLKLSLGVFVLFLPVALPSLVKYFAKLFSYNNYLTGGNAWASVYGLVNNNTTWQEAYSRVPSSVGNSEMAINQYLKTQTLTDFKNHPFTIIESVFENLFSMTSKVFPFFSPVTLTASGIFSGFLFIISVLFILGFLIKLIYKPIYLNIKIFVFLFVTSTLLFYSVTWKSEPARSLSPTFVLFVFLIIYIFSNYSKLRTKTALTLKRSLVHSFALALLPLISITSLIAINRIPEREFELPNNYMSCTSDDFIFDRTTVTTTRIENIRTFRAFGWSNLIDQLPAGYLIQGITNFGNKPFAVTGFVETNQFYSNSQIVNSCFVFKTDSIFGTTLSELNFAALKITS